MSGKMHRLKFCRFRYSFFVPENKPDVSIHDFREEVEADAERHIIFYITSGNEMQHFYFPPGRTVFVKFLRNLCYAEASKILSKI